MLHTNTAFMIITHIAQDGGAGWTGFHQGESTVTASSGPIETTHQVLNGNRTYLNSFVHMRKPLQMHYSHRVSHQTMGEQAGLLGSPPLPRD